MKCLPRVLQAVLAMLLLLVTGAQAMKVVLQNAAGQDKYHGTITNYPSLTQVVSWAHVSDSSNYPSFSVFIHHYPASASDPTHLPYLAHPVCCVTSSQEHGGKVVYKDQQKVHSFWNFIISIITHTDKLFGEFYFIEPLLFKDDILYFREGSVFPLGMSNGEIIFGFPAVSLSNDFVYLILVVFSLGSDTQRPRLTIKIFRNGRIMFTVRVLESLVQRVAGCGKPEEQAVASSGKPPPAPPQPPATGTVSMISMAAAIAVVMGIGDGADGSVKP